MDANNEEKLKLEDYITQPAVNVAIAEGVIDPDNAESEGGKIARAAVTQVAAYDYFFGDNSDSSDSSDDSSEDTPVLCEVTLDDDGDYDGNGSASVAAGDLALNDLVAPLREGYHVEGYYAAGTGDKVAEADGTLVADVEGYTDETGAWVYEGESVTLYAHWTADEVVEQPADPNAEPEPGEE